MALYTLSDYYVTGNQLYTALRDRVNITVPTITARNALQTYQRRWGMLVYVYDDSVPENNGPYFLVKNNELLSDNTNWEKFVGGAGDSLWTEYEDLLLPVDELKKVPVEYILGLVQNGDGTLFLADDGTYKAAGAGDSLWVEYEGLLMPLDELNKVPANVIDGLIQDGDGDLFLSDDGTYKTAGGGSSLAKASIAEIDAGTDDSKYITPAGIEGSAYMRVHIGSTAPTDTTMLWLDTA